MTPSEAANIYRETSERIAAVADDMKLRSEAEKVLKDYAKAHPEKRSFKKIAFTRGSQKRFSQAMAKEMLGAKKSAECVTTVETVSLTIL